MWRMGHGAGMGPGRAGRRWRQQPPRETKVVGQAQAVKVVEKVKFWVVFKSRTNRNC